MVMKKTQKQKRHGVGYAADFDAELAKRWVKGCARQIA